MIDILAQLWFLFTASTVSLFVVVVVAQALMSTARRLSAAGPLR